RAGPPARLRHRYAGCVLGSRTRLEPFFLSRRQIAGGPLHRPAAPAPAAWPGPCLALAARGRRLERRTPADRGLPPLQGLLTLARGLDEDLEQQQGVVEVGLTGEAHPLVGGPAGLAQALEADQGVGHLLGPEIREGEALEEGGHLLLDHGLDS